MADSAQAIKAQAVRTVTDVAEKLKAQGNTLFQDQKAWAADGLDGISHSIRASAESLQTGPLSEVSSYVEAAADGVERASRYLAEKDLAALRHDAEDAVRRQPAWFLGGMFVLGLAIARFAKAKDGSAWTPRQPDEPSENRVVRRRRATLKTN